MSWTLDEAKLHLKTWLDAELAVATGGQSYKIGTRSLTRADLPDIMAQIKFWRNEVARLQSGASGGSRVLRAVPRDF